VVAVTVKEADEGHPTTLRATVISAAEPLEAVLPADARWRDVVADKGFHSNASLTDLTAIGLRTYISEPDRGRRRWRRHRDAQAAVYANRRRIRGRRGVGLLRRRGGYLERTVAPLDGPGGMRPTP